MTNQIRQAYFYATREDLEAALDGAETDRRFTYTLCGLFASEQPESYDGASSLPRLGIAEVGDSNREPSYLIVAADAEVVARPVVQRRGGLKYAIDQQANPNSIVFRPGGVYRDIAVIAGMLGAVGSGNESAALMDLFLAKMQESYRRIGPYSVGPGAEKLWREGYRLTLNLSGPAKYDLADSVERAG